MDPKSILVIQLRRIGDVILTTPALAALKRRFPAAAIDVLVEPPGAEALEGNPHVREVVVYDARGPLAAARWMLRLRARRYDWVVDFLGNPRSALLTAASAAAVKAGPAHVGHRWAYNRPLPQSPQTCYAALEKIRALAPLGVTVDESQTLPRIYLARRRSGPNVIGLVPASRKITRRWPAASFAALGRLLRGRFGSQLRVLWGPGERALAEEVCRGIGAGACLAAETPRLKALAELIADCRLVVTNCNGPKHMAVALGVPTVTVHGSSDPAAWNPPHPRHVVERREDLFCIGCQKNACPYALECLEQLAPETVFEACCRLLQSEAAKAEVAAQ